MTETTKLYILISVYVTLTFIQGHSCMTNRKLRCSFLRKFAIHLDENQYVATNCMFAEPHARFSCTSNIQGRELCWRDYIKYTINIVLCRDTCEQICFKIGMMLVTTRLYSLVPVPESRELKHVQSFFCKFARSNTNVRGGWLCKGNYCEEVLYGKYG